MFWCDAWPIIPLSIAATEPHRPPVTYMCLAAASLSVDISARRGGKQGVKVGEQGVNVAKS